MFVGFCLFVLFLFFFKMCASESEYGQFNLSGQSIEYGWSI